MSALQIVLKHHNKSEAQCNLAHLDVKPAFCWILDYLCKQCSESLPGIVSSGGAAPRFSTFGSLAPLCRFSVPRCCCTLLCLARFLHTYTCLESILCMYRT